MGTTDTSGGSIDLRVQIVSRAPDQISIAVRVKPMTCSSGPWPDVHR